MTEQDLHDFARFLVMARREERYTPSGIMKDFVDEFALSEHADEIDKTNLTLPAPRRPHASVFHERPFLQTGYSGYAPALFQQFSKGRILMNPSCDKCASSRTRNIFADCVQARDVYGNLMNDGACVNCFADGRGPICTFSKCCCDRLKFNC